MKISETTSFPHPVLAPWSTDIAGATIATEISFREERDENRVSIHCAAAMDQPDILRLIQEGSATFGCYIRCQETGLRRLQHFGFPSGVQHFAPGALLGNVQLRPMVWSTSRIAGYKPQGAHAEFSEGSEIESGQILALDDEQVIEVTRPPLPSIESVFEIISSDEITEGKFDIDTQSDRIIVRMGERTYQLVQSLRLTDDATRAVVMNSLFVPIVMQVLDQLSEGYEPFEQYRWLHPFRARCELVRVDVKKPDLLTDAQRLLEQPFASLAALVYEEDSVDVATA
ncbi:hypothetical protein [Variovorax ginsengisoli]|uniref:Hedgehog/Intein (Hint) domain-containing protein n=1 Tax=Variovorax ginsengisoli TaxID=363844 RepID=A0ABT8SC20_9BURK|nr:hypothetical protein [Variovorax ginsengisoli]MDN8617300.1 hypothetical protein [Variovorax ginsengisoli]MDO1536470.1 hypothetical protein [Variovorax ginsengisoli]